MSKKTVNKKKTGMALDKINYQLLAIAFVIVVIGFLLMTGSSNNDPQVFNEDIYSFRRITLAPVVVLFGFLFGIYAILKKPSDENSTEKNSN